MTRYVYAFGGGTTDGNAGMKDILGGKGANLAEMARIGLPVPPGFTITTEVCRDYYTNDETYPEGMWEQVDEALQALEPGELHCLSTPSLEPLTPSTAQS